MKKSNFTLALVMFVIFQGSIMSQDLHFSQFVLSPLNLNPALAGANHEIQAIVNYRDQWRSVASPYKTYGFSYDMRLTGKKKKTAGFWALGFNVNSDKAGDAGLSNTIGQLTLAYHLYVADKSTLGAGFFGSYGNTNISNQSNFQWASQYDGMKFNSNLESGESASYQPHNFIDAGAGILYTYKSSERYLSANDQFNINMGFSVFHITRYNNGFIEIDEERQNIKYVYFLNTLIGLGNTRLAFVPNILYQRQGALQEIIAGGSFRYLMQEESKYTGVFKGSAISFGGLYRVNDSFILTSFLEWAEYSVGISYDLNVSKLKAASSARGGLEIALRYILPNPFGGSKSRLW